MDINVDHYGSQYSNFVTDLYQQVRSETYIEDIGQNGWHTAQEQNMFLEWLDLHPDHTLLDVACGSGGPAIRIAQLTECSIIGIDIHEDGINTAKEQRRLKGLSGQADFKVLDGGAHLPFEDNSFDAIICIDAINHFPERAYVFKEWNRILKPKGKLLFTDPITVTGILTKKEAEIRTSIGYFLLVAEGVNESLLKETGFRLIEKKNSTKSVALIARKWKDARERRANEIMNVEGFEAFEGQQSFFSVCAQLAESGNLSRFVFFSEKL